VVILIEIDVSKLEVEFKIFAKRVGFVKFSKDDWPW